MSLMETCEKPISSSRDHYRHPSFSSTLLDQIYRSIDEDREFSPDKLVFHRRSIAADFERSRRTTSDSIFLRYYNSSSSDSSGFSSSSSSDSFYGRSKSFSSPPPIRTSVESGLQKPNSKQEPRKKSKALKIYTDLKNVKQPISPGGRLAAFLNSLFTSAASSLKKPQKIRTAVSVAEPQSVESSSTTCSSASSFSRSCLSKTPSSSGKSKRSVRFCPVHVILDEDSSIHIPYGYSNNDDAKRNFHVMEEKNRRVIEAAKDLLKTYHKNKNHLAVTTTAKCDDIINVEEEEEDDDDDTASYSSSDLFELENLSPIGIERYGEELPVYETTRLDNTNRAIASTLTV